ncbi:tyrosine-type recombinase/integrase [Microtetraspora sp. NBRC 16547]|uniref:tyrosine-type recombinase/integrase n=1 Tax=Microtetraspora sp. NBRC 16547 TaxID=3030993 RepID=UPI002555799B|nr:tyrosine-type recombinase/integrase [Microtetraspora sp. NBRC 16547]
MCGSQPGVPPPSGTGPQAARPDGGRAEGRRCGGAPRRRLDTGELLVGPPKSRAGVRTVAIPSAIIPALRDHLDDFTDPEDDALIFTGARGGTLRRSNFRRAADWTKNTKKIGFPGLHFHDLRHTGNTIAASSGATLRDLMERMGHDSVRAAMIYQHRTAEADRKIANAMNDKIAEALPSN